MGGDFNETFFNFEKKGGSDKQQAVLENFHDAFLACNLHELGFSGYKFTWSNRRDDDQSIEERLDGFCAIIQWSLFSSAKVLHIDAKLSDHLSIQLKLSGNNLTSRIGGKRGFKFKNMWALHDKCGEIVKSF